MQKRVLIPNGNYSDIPLIKAFKKMGFYVITSGNDPTLEGHKYADEYILHDYSDYKGMLRIAEKLDLDYVSTCANDFGVITASYIADHLGLPGHDSFEVARTIAEKDRFKTFAQKNKLRVIPSRPFEDKEAALSYIKDCEYPVIVKPTDLTGGKGVSRADDPRQAEKAVSYAFERSKAKRIVIEPFVTGTQHSVMCFLVNRKVISCMSYNEYGSQFSPYLVGDASSPIDNMERIGPILFEQIEKIAELLKLKDGVFHAQFRIHNGEPMIMECMRRCLGNYALQQAQIMTGFEWEDWIARSYCGLDCGGIPHVLYSDHFSAEYYIQAPKNGIVKNLEISPLLSPYVRYEMMQWHPGMRIERHEVEMLGFLIMEFPDREKMLDAIEKKEEYVHITMEE